MLLTNDPKLDTTKVYCGELEREVGEIIENKIYIYYGQRDTGRGADDPYLVKEGTLIMNRGYVPLSSEEWTTYHTKNRRLMIDTGKVTRGESWYGQAGHEGHFIYVLDDADTEQFAKLQGCEWLNAGPRWDT